MAQEKIIRYVCINDRGLRIGESHHKAKLTNKEVDEVRDLHEILGWGYRKIAREYGVSKSCIAEICRYEKRADTPFDWKKVVVIRGVENV